MWWPRYRKSLSMAVSASAGPYGYTLAIWTSGGVLVHHRGIPTAFEAILFMGGAVIAFAMVGALAFGGFTQHFVETPRRMSLWGSFHFVSVGLAIAAAAIVASFVENTAAWPICAFLVTFIYLVITSGQFLLAAQTDD